jgi:secreted trypsin-like serine protease
MKAKSASAAAALGALISMLAICLVSLGPAPGAQATGSPTTAQASIVGGRQATPGMFPWMAFIVDFPGGETVTACSGTVLAPRVILTAAHCTLDEGSGSLNDPAGYRVVTGAVDWTLPERQVSEVTRLIPYPKFVTGKGRDGFGDAALMVLATPVTAPPIPIATPTNSGLIRIGTHGVIAGWGQTYAEQEGPTESLMWSKTMVGGVRCEGLWGRICAIDVPRATSGACHGDSGGPLVVRRKHGDGWIEIGITEAGFGACSTRRPQLYTRTDLLAHWIQTRVAAIETG